MARKRAESGTGYYHIMSRGNNRGAILKKKVDKKKFLKILEECVDDEKVQIYAYCVMNNHYHLLIKAMRLEDLSIVMQRINSFYAHYYKIKYGYVGHVFQDRFLSKPLHTINYISNVIRYIHQNPVKAGMETEAAGYEFSSYREYGSRKSNLIIAKDWGNVIETLGFKGVKEFRQYHIQREDLSGDAQNEVFFDKEEYRYEEFRAIKEMELAKTVEMRNQIKNYPNLPLCGKREFAKLIVNSTITLSNREIPMIAMVGRNKLVKSVPPGPS